MAASSRRVLLWGPIRGALATFRDALRLAVAKYGHFDVCFCIGDFFGRLAVVTDEENDDILARVCEILPTQVSVPVVILDRPRNGSLGAKLRSAFPHGEIVLNDQFTLLPHIGCTTISGLRVAFCSGEDADKITDIQEVIDICLFTAWPATVKNGLDSQEQDILESILSTQSSADWPVEARTASLFASSVKAARYYVATGGPCAFYERPAFTPAERVDFISRFISLADMPSALTDRLPDISTDGKLAISRKHAHALKLVPWSDRERCVLSQNPFVLLGSSGSSSSNGEPALKRHKDVSMRWGTETTGAPWTTRRSIEIPTIPEQLLQRPTVLSLPETPDTTGNGARVVYVSNVPYAATREDLHACLSAFGPVVDVRMPRTTTRGAGGRAWVTFEKAKDAEAALTAPHIELFGRNLRIVFANIQDQTKLKEIAIARNASEGGPPVTAVQPPSTTNSSPSSNSPIPPSRQLSFTTTSPEVWKSPAPPVDVRPHAGRDLKLLLPNQPLDCWFCLYNSSCERELIVSIGEQVYIAIARGGIVPQHLMILPISHQPSAALFPKSLLKEITATMRNLASYFHSLGLACVFYERYGPMKVTRAMHTQIHVVPIPQHLIGACREAFQKMAAAQQQVLRNVTLESLGDDLATSEDSEEERARIIAANSYHWVDLPLDSSSADNRWSFVCTSEDRNRRWNFHFSREVLCHVLAAPERVRWKSCVTSRPEEENWAAHVRLGFEAYLMGTTTQQADSEIKDLTLNNGSSSTSSGGEDLVVSTITATNNLPKE